MLYKRIYEDAVASLGPEDADQSAAVDDASLVGTHNQLRQAMLDTEHGFEM